jgi:hypothetical protein
MTMDAEAVRAFRRERLEAPDPLAAVPARFLSAQGFAERVLRMIATQEKEGAPADVVLRLIRERCEHLAWEVSDGHR